MGDGQCSLCRLGRDWRFCAPWRDARLAMGREGQGRSVSAQLVRKSVSECQGWHGVGVWALCVLDGGQIEATYGKRVNRWRGGRHMGMNHRERPYAICFSSQRPQGVNLADDVANDVGYDARTLVTGIFSLGDRAMAPFHHGDVIAKFLPYRKVRQAGYKHRFSHKINPARE